jgi:hypothetical protein
VAEIQPLDYFFLILATATVCPITAQAILDRREKLVNGEINVSENLAGVIG